MREKQQNGTSFDDIVKVVLHSNVADVGPYKVIVQLRVGDLPLGGWGCNRRPEYAVANRRLASTSQSSCSTGICVELSNRLTRLRIVVAIVALGDVCYRLHLLLISHGALCHLCGLPRQTLAVAISLKE